MIDERLTPSFWLSEFLRSETSTRLGLDNDPPPEVLANLRTVLAPAMQHVRDMLGYPVNVSSGYRSTAVNKAVGGSATSQHALGLACDFTCPHYGTPRRVAEFLALHFGEARFDQLIWEGSWVHISFVPGRPRGQVLTAHFGRGGVTYTPGIEERRPA